MLDRNAGLERQISLAHGPAIALAAQEIADGIGFAGQTVWKNAYPSSDYAKATRRSERG